MLWTKLSLMVVMLLSAVSFTACVDDNEDVGMPFLELDIEELPLTEEGGTATFTVSTNRPWTATLGEGSEWISLSKMEGAGTEEVEISVPATTYGRVGEVAFHLSNTYAVYETKTLVVKQGEVEEEEIIYSETVGTQSVSSPYPFVDAYTSWQTDGTGASTVTYTGKSASVRASGLANAGSGPNVIFFGTLPAYFQVNTITLQPQHQRLALTFLGSHSKQDEVTKEFDNVFNFDNFKVEISGDGKKWSQLECTKDNGDAEHPYWISAESKFILTEVPEQLSIRFTAATASVFRLDDIRLVTFNGTATEIDLSQGTEDGGSTGGDTPTPTPTDALWHENFGDNGEDKPLVKDYTAWEKGGSVGANVTYEAPSGNVSVRESGKLSAGYADASGAGKLFFGTNNPVFVVGNIALTAEQTKLRLNFGGAYSKQTSGVYDNTFYKEKFHVFVSGDGEAWTELTYTTAQADEFWVYATADFTLSKPSEKLYFKYTADEVSVFAIDDAQLAVGEGGQTIELGAGTGGDEPTPTPTDKIFYESFGTPVKEGTYWPYANENAQNIMSGTGVVAGTTTYNSYSVTARTVGTYTAPNPPTSGEGHIWFPSGKTADKNFFEVQKLALNGEKNLDISFYLHGNTEAYAEGDVTLELSADGETWTKVAFTTGSIAEAPESSWKVAKASVTLKASPAQLYMKFSSATTGGCRLDDPTIVKGNGGTEIDLGAGTGGDEPTPPTPTAGEYDGDYLMVAYVDGAWKAATPVPADKAYGYLQPTDVTVSGNAITADATAKSLNFALKQGATTGQYSLYGADGRYYYLSGTHNSTNVTAELGTEGYYWSVAKNNDNTFTLTNVTMSKTLQYDTQYGSYGVYPDVRGLYVYLFKLNAAGTAYEALSELPSTGGTTEPDQPDQPDQPDTPDTPDQPATGGGTDDFATLNTATSYTTQTTTAGWVGENCAVQAGGDKDSNPTFQSLLGNNAETRGMVMNGKTTAVGKITSPTLTGGCGTLSFDYGFAFSESKGINFKVEIKQNGTTVKSFDVVKSDAVKLQKCSFSETVNVSGDFQIVFTNNSPSQSTSNKDRYTIFNVKWTGVN